MPSTALHHRVSIGVWEARLHMAGYRVRPPKSSKHRNYRGGHRAAILAVFLLLAITGLYLDRPVKSEYLGEKQKLAQTSVTSFQVYPKVLNKITDLSLLRKRHTNGLVLKQPCFDPRATV